MMTVVCSRLVTAARDVC